MGKSGYKQTLGIYISPKEISISQVKVVKGSRLETEHLVKFPTGFTAKEGMLRPLSLNNDFFNPAAAWITPFKQAVKKVSWGTASVVVTLSPQFAILRYFVMPFIPRKFWSKSIPLESKKYIPVSFEEVVYDFSAVPLEDGKKLGVLFGLTQRKSVESLLATLKSVGLDLAAIEINSASLERLFAYADPKDHDSKGYVHFHGNSTYMLFSQGGFPVLYREAESDASGTMSDRRRLDIKGAVQFVDRYVGGKDYATILLSGDGSEAWKEAAAREAAPIAVALWDPAAACSLKDSDPASLFSNGAALRGLAPGKITLDISGISTAAGLEKKVQGYVWTITFLLSGLLLILSMVAQSRLFILNSKLASVRALSVGMPELEGKDPEAIRVKITEMQTNVKMLYTLLADKDTLAPKLSAIADNIPGDLWVSGIVYSNPIPVSEMQNTGKQLTITGQTMLRGERKISVAENFKKALKAAPEFKPFGPPRGSVELTIQAEAQSQAMSFSQTEAGPLPGEFTVMCVSKTK